MHLARYHSLWNSILDCFTLGEAAHLHFIYGDGDCQQMVQNRFSGVPNAETWLDLVQSRSYGLLLHFQTAQLPCTFYHRIVQYCIDEGLLVLLVFFTSGHYTFYDENQQVILANACYRIDEAAVDNHLLLVRYCLARFPNLGHRMIRKPRDTLLRLIRLRAKSMLQVLIPQYLKIEHVDRMLATIETGDFDIFSWCAEHWCVPQVRFPDDVIPTLMPKICEHQNWSVLHWILTRQLAVTPSSKVLQVVYLTAPLEVVKYVEQCYPFLRIDPETFKACLEKGRYEVVKHTSDPYPPLPWTYPLFKLAVRSRQLDLVQFVRHQLHGVVVSTRFFKSVIEQCSSNDDALILCLFCWGEFTSVTPDVVLRCIHKKLYRMLEFLYQCNLLPLSETFFYAVCDEADCRMLTLFVAERIPELCTHPDWIKQGLQRARQTIKLREQKRAFVTLLESYTTQEESLANETSNTPAPSNDARKYLWLSQLDQLDDDEC